MQPRGLSHWRAFFAASSLFFLLTIPVFAQVSTLGTITGTVTDPTGAVVPEASVTVTNMANGQSSKVTTNASGDFTVPNLPNGDYKLAVEKTGFKRLEKSSLHLDPAAVVHTPLVLELGQTTEVVEVTAETVLVETNTTQVSRVVNSQTLTEIPVNGRNYINMLALQPGVATSFTFNSFNATSLFASQNTHINGLRGDSNNFIIGGTSSTRTRANGATVAQPSEESISEVNVITTGYMPEYARGAAGQVVVQLKAGSDQYHGSAFEFARNDKLDARDFFQPKRAKLRFHDFGGSIGGPVIPRHHNAYFFATGELFRRRAASNVLATVPSLKDRNGDFSDFCVANPSRCPVVPAFLNGRKTSAGVLTAGQPFPNNTIPKELFSPNGQAFVLAQALPTKPGEANNLAGTFANPLDQHEESVRGDYYSDKLKTHFTVALRHFYQESSSVNAAGGGNELITEGFQFPSRAASFDATTTFTPTLLNDFTFGANEDIVHVNSNPGLQGNGLARESLGINFPYIEGVASKDFPGKIPTIITSGFSTISGLPDPRNSVGHVWTVQDTVTKITGPHTFKVGTWIQWNGENDGDQVRVTPGGGVGNNLNGQFTFNASSSNPRTTKCPLCDEFLGNFNNYTEIGFRNLTKWQARSYAFFAQDSWKVNKHLTVEGGLRWDYFGPFRAKDCNFAGVDPSFYSALPGTQQVVDPKTGLVIGGNPFNGIGVPCAGLPQDAFNRFGLFGLKLNTQANFQRAQQALRDFRLLGHNENLDVQRHSANFAPRLGIAWDPIGDGRTVIRASGGIFFNQTTLSDVTLEGGNAPFQIGVNVDNGSADNPGTGVTFNPLALPTPQSPAATIPITGQGLQSKTPRIYQYNFTVQHMFNLRGDTLVSASYVGTQARNLIINRDVNQPALGAFNVNNPNGFNPNFLRPLPGLSRATEEFFDANSKYDSLQVSVQRRFTRGLQYGVAYTLSKCFDVGDDLYSVATDPNNLNLDRGLCGFDHRHALVLNYVYELPFHDTRGNKLSKLYGGWSFSGVTSVISGGPLSIGASRGDIAGVGGAGPQFADIVPGCKIGASPKNDGGFPFVFNPACFKDPSPGTFGNASRGIGGGTAGPFFANFDWAFLKGGQITALHGEGIHYEFRVELFNIFNHPSFQGVSTGLGNRADFGRVNSTAGARNVELGIRLTF